MAKFYSEMSEKAKELTGCKNCLNKLPKEDDKHCTSHEVVPLIVFEEGFCFQHEHNT